MLTCRLLGAVEVSLDDQQIDLGFPRQRTLLAILLVEANRLVTVETLIDRIWADQPPSRASDALYASVSKLRRSLVAASGLDVVRRTGGYVIEADPTTIDLHCFRSLCARARQPGTDDDVAALLDEALAHWQGEAFAGLDNPWLTNLRVSLHSEKLAALLDRTDACLRLGRHAQMLPDLADLRAAHPLDERLAAQHVLALHRCGRSTEALAHYRSFRRRLAEELGIDPNQQLQELHDHILRNDPALAPSSPAQPFPASSAAVVPFQLPADTLHFTGRAKHLARLLDLGLHSDDPENPSKSRTVVVTAVEGMAGIGKTALAVHAAHRVTDLFPDGVLFTDLHGFTPQTRPTPPEHALDHLLRGLGVPGSHIPPDLESRTGLYRSLLATRRVLLVLDNAADETQLGPLLPAVSSCRAIVTSRRHLAGLDDAIHLTLSVLPLADATGLFRGLAGDRVTPADQPTVERIVALCGRLPLAIRIAAARLRQAAAATPAKLCAELEDALDAGTGLEWLSDGHRVITTALEASYWHLTDQQQRVFRLVGLHPGHGLEPYAVAALADTTTEDARRLLEQLHGASLLDQPDYRRYTLHDLVAAYATRLAAELPEPDQHAALDRLYDHYAATSSRAVTLTHPWAVDRQPRPPVSHTPAPTLSDRYQAQVWLDAETENLLAAARHAATRRRADHALLQSATLHPYLRTRGYYTQAAQLHQQALQHTRAAANRAAEQETLNRLGHIHRLQGRYVPATDCFEQALDIARQTGHPDGQQDALTGLGYIHHRHGSYGAATDCFEQALDIARRTSRPDGEQDALRGLAAVHSVQDRYEPAIDCFEQALDIARRIGHPEGEQIALRGLGHLYGMQYRDELAGDYYQQALEIARQIGHRTAERHALLGLGNVHHRQERYQPALEHYGQALDIARQTGDRDGELYVLRGLGTVHYAQGRYGPALDQFKRALLLADQTGDRNGRYEAHQNLGRVHHATGDHRNALRHHQIALDLAVDLGQPADQARAHDGLAHTHLALDNTSQARHHWQAALALLTSIGVEHIDESGVATTAIRIHLHDLDKPTNDPRPESDTSEPRHYRQQS